LKDQYGTLVQSIRMISCTGQNVWRQQPKKHSTAAIAVDSDGRLLLIHVGSLYTTHDLVEILQAMPLNISRAMYTEGGPQAQLHVRCGSKVYNFAGGYEMNFIEGDGAALYRPVPNVIGIAPK
jgi:glucose/arabinose dehydrogenase